MLNRVFTLAIAASVSAVATIASGCATESPSAPSPGLSVTSLVPTSGSTAGTTVVRILGTGFGPGSRVTVDGAATDVTARGATWLSLTMPAHAAGPVDVAVVNPSGQRVDVPAAFTYLVTDPPVVTDLAPNSGTTGGGALVTITGTGFQPLVRVTVDGVFRSSFVGADGIFVQMQAHAAGAVDVVVTNPDGQSHRVVGGFTFAPPDSFDFNGDWVGVADDGSHLGTIISFTIRDDVVVSVSCAAATGLTLSPPPAVRNGEFFSFGTTGLGMSGRILSASQATGQINVVPCLEHGWLAQKKAASQNLQR